MGISKKYFLRLLALFAWAVIVPTAFGEDAMWSGLPAPVAEVTIKVEDDHPNGLDWERLARTLIRLKPGDRLTTERLNEAIQDLSSITGARVETQARAQGMALLFTIRPFKRIKTIAVDGAYPLFEKDVLNAMTVAVGDLFFEGKMLAQEEAIRQRYRAEGYVDPRVLISWTRDAHDGHHHLRARIDKGEYYHVARVRLHGNRAISDARILGRLKTWRASVFALGSGRFQGEALRQDARRLTDYYRREGFADVVIAAQAHRVAGTRGMVCDFTIEEGPRYTLRLEGNRFFSRFRLRKELVLFEVGNLGNIGLRRTVRNIRRRYLMAGFDEVKVLSRESDRLEEGLARREMTIAIEEGPRRLVTAVHVAGNAHMREKTLRKQMLTRPSGWWRGKPYVAETLQEDLVAIEALYHSHGFLDAQVNEAVKADAQGTGVDVTVSIDEGVRTRVDHVSRQGGDALPRDPLATELELRPGAAYTPFKLQNDINRVSAHLAEMGYPHADVQSSPEIRADHTQVDIVYRLVPGPAVQTGQIFFLGNFRTRERILRREMDMAPGEPFGLQKVLESQRNLRNLNIFDSVQVVPVGLKEKEAVVDLLVSTVEKKPYYFESGGGYQTDTGLFGRSKIGDLNFLGTGKDAALSGRISEVGYRWDAGMGEPRFLGLPIRARAGIYGERSEPFNQDFGTDTRGGKLNFSHDWKANNTFGLAARIEQREQYARDAGATLAEDPDAFDTRTVAVVTPSVQYDGRDSFIRPRRGQFAGLSVDISKGFDNTLDDFLKYRLDLRTYHAVMEGVTLAARGEVGYLSQYGGDVSPQDQLFFLGGTNSVRGFEENLLRFDAGGNAAGGQLAITAGLEARIEIGHDFELTTFLDTGSVRQSETAVGDDDLRWSAGLGLQYITPIGPVGLFYGHKLDRRDDESAGQVHLSIGYAF